MEIVSPRMRLKSGGGAAGWTQPWEPQYDFFFYAPSPSAGMLWAAPASVACLPWDVLAHPSSSSSPFPPSILALLLCLGLEAGPGCWGFHPSECTGGTGGLLGTLELSLPGVSQELGLDPKGGHWDGIFQPLILIRVPWEWILSLAMGSVQVGNNGRPGGQ